MDRYLTERPHHAGSPRNTLLAEEIARRWRSYGFDKVEMPRYNVLQNLPMEEDPSFAAIVDDKGAILHQFQEKETPLTTFERKHEPEVMPSFLSSPLNASVDGDVVYVNYGRDEDFDKLKELGVSVKGRIAFMRMGRVYRGNKVRSAGYNGAIAALIYQDPEQFAPEGPNNTFPNSWWLPDTGIQRGGAGLGSWPGDPLTTGYPAVDGIYRMPVSKLGQPKIPSYGLSYGDALKILKRMKGKNPGFNDDCSPSTGPDVPPHWEGKLDVRYRLGPGFTQENTKVHLTTKSKRVMHPIFNVIGTIRGREEPDRYVIVGNHRDSWVFGASDPSSGTAIQMEVSRGLGELLKRGWRPRRTIILCSWDSEERGVSGSTEWVEEHAQILRRRAVVYLNIDTGVSGNFSLNVDGSPLIEKILVATSKEVQDPTTKHAASMYDVITERDKTKLRGGVPVCDNLALGSDYVAFYHLIGVSSADWSYIFGDKKHKIRRSYPLYHSIHDNFEWMKRFVDPQFQIHLAVGKFTSRMVMKMANSIVLPFNATNFALKLKSEINELKRLPGLDKSPVDLRWLINATNVFVDRAVKFDTAVTHMVKSDLLARRRVNDQLMQVDRAFINTLVQTSRLYDRHVLYGPDWTNIYKGVYFHLVKRAIRDAEAGKDSWDAVEKEVSVLTFCLRSAAEMLEPEE
ncbi:predicted protein [Nematostella vectensis]|uniref:glutamate carboxypeptidase II n=1 Tax=Nematostella vectensis TaxID=45351 RepID=A7SPP2_NEMVE|nr:predicted protein [Nematostella vectensis]|eukprot:XP_001626457.1 predicted protein [Nematostella vectensis]